MNVVRVHTHDYSSKKQAGVKEAIYGWSHKKMSVICGQMFSLNLFPNGFLQKDIMNFKAFFLFG